MLTITDKNPHCVAIKFLNTLASSVNLRNNAKHNKNIIYEYPLDLERYNLKEFLNKTVLLNEVDIMSANRCFYMFYLLFIIFERIYNVIKHFCDISANLYTQYTFLVQ